MTLELALKWLFGGPGAGILAYNTVKRVKWFERFSSADKRTASFVVAVLYAVLGYMLAVGMLYVVGPVSWRGWLEELFAIAFATVITAQTLHGYKELDKPLK